MQTGGTGTSSSEGHDSGSSSYRDLDHGPHIYQPKWHKLLDAVAQALVSRIRKSADRPHARSDGGLAPDVFISGGGEAFNFTASSSREGRTHVIDTLRPLIDALDLSEKDTGAVLIGVHFFLQREGLPASPATWRVLAMAAILSTLQLVFRKSGKGESAREKLLGSVERWCARPRAEAACDALTEWMPAGDVVRCFEMDVKGKKREGSSSSDTGDAASSGELAARGDGAAPASSGDQQRPQQHAEAAQGQADDGDECSVASI